MEFIPFVYYFLAAAVVGYAGSTRKIGFVLGLVASLLLTPLLGLVLVAFSEKEQHRYLDEFNKGKKAEYRDDVASAKAHYLNALWHLENDYKQLNQTLAEAKTQVTVALKRVS